MKREILPRDHIVARAFRERDSAGTPSGTGYVVTINRDASAETWWAAAAARTPAPADLRSLLSDPQCVRATISADSLRWCRALPGWRAKPLTVSYPSTRPSQLLVRLPVEEHQAVLTAASRARLSVNAWVRTTLAAATDR